MYAVFVSDPSRPFGGGALRPETRNASRQVWRGPIVFPKTPPSDSAARTHPKPPSGGGQKQRPPDLPRAQMFCSEGERIGRGQKGVFRGGLSYISRRPPDPWESLGNPKGIPQGFPGVRGPAAYISQPPSEYPLLAAAERRKHK